jgi:hypothetical protein
MMAKGEGEMTARIVSGLCGLFLLLFAGPTAAFQPASFSKIVDNIEIDIGVMPAAAIRHYAAHGPERDMHGGLPTENGEYHVVVALFDAATGTRITTADVSAYVHEIGVGGTEKKLSPMAIAGTVTWGNYFPMSTSAPCHIALTIRIPGRERPIHATFEHWNS